jgi:hypothetical protein
MKRLSMSLPAIALVLVLALSGTAFTSSPAAADYKIEKAPVYSLEQSFLFTHSFHKVYVYYWFWMPGDSYNDEETQAMEVWEMENIYYPGTEVDTNPTGGTLILEGYMMPNQPHMAYPAVYLYAHF